MCENRALQEVLVRVREQPEAVARRVEGVDGVVRVGIRRGVTERLAESVGALHRVAVEPVDGEGVLELAAPHLPGRDPLGRGSAEHVRVVGAAVLVDVLGPRVDPVPGLLEALGEGLEVRVREALGLDRRAHGGAEVPVEQRAVAVERHGADRPAIERLQLGDDAA